VIGRNGSEAGFDIHIKGDIVDIKGDILIFPLRLPTTVPPSVLIVPRTP